MTTKQHINDPARNTRDRVAKLHAGGATAIEIAKALGISRQRVYQHLAALREGATR